MNRAEYQIEIDEFESLDKKLEDVLTHFTSGEFLKGRIPDAQFEFIKREFNSYLESLKSLLEERNAKRTSAANALRSLVKITETQWRGPHGSPTTMSYGPFVVTSVTKRTFDPEELAKLATKYGVLDRIEGLKSYEAKSGKERKMFERKWVVNDYEGLLSWLELNNLEKIVKGSYDEKESTPQVKGPKLLTFLGEEKKD